MKFAKKLEKLSIAMICCIGFATPAFACDEAKDLVMEQQIKDVLNADPMTKATTIAIDVDNGVVILTGFVPDQQTRRNAMIIASEFEGVETVTNRMIVSK